MKRSVSLILLSSFCAVAALAQQSDTSSASVVHVATALNHLTVLEFHEPVTMAAAGSSDFQIERESNKVFVKPIKSGAATDLFVWTASRRFAYELEITQEVKNWPPDYAAGKKYPLVIQTHGWDPDKFWMDGPWTTAFSAQALAGKGFLVLQVPDPDSKISDTAKEAPRAMAAYESAIAYLDQRGLIDRNRVGITGFSRTYWYVTYMLTHSKHHHFAAAALADGVDFSFFQYMAFSDVAREFEPVYGGPPYKRSMSRWLKQSPAFLMDKIETPLRIQTLGPDSVLSDWHWYTGLSLLGKPVEMIYIPEGTHILEKPWERMISQHGNVDWFCFWLKGEEDPDPAKAAQYKRWRELRSLKGRTTSAASTQ